MSAELTIQIGRRLRRIRRMRNLTQKEVANKIVGRVDYTYIGKIERGEQLPSLKVLEKLSDALAAPLAFFSRKKPHLICCRRNSEHSAEKRKERRCSGKSLRYRAAISHCCWRSSASSTSIAG
ncbi:MAG: helix-turn-helix transcriptional regulator [Candidatus Methylomirabilis sp.]|nr:helix-turn-helix transcriptional regulator [Candidatus Methylomirabilis sp.]